MDKKTSVSQQKMPRDESIIPRFHPCYATQRLFLSKHNSKVPFKITFYRISTIIGSLEKMDYFYSSSSPLQLLSELNSIISKKDCKFFMAEILECLLKLAFGNGFFQTVLFLYRILPNFKSESKVVAFESMV